MQAMLAPFCVAAHSQAVAVRAHILTAKFFHEFFFKSDRDGMFQAFSLVVDLIPGQAKNLSQHPLDQVVPKNCALRDFVSLGAQLNAAIFACFHETIFSKTLQCGGHCRTRDMEPTRKSSRDDSFAFSLGLCNGLEIVFFGNSDIWIGMQNKPLSSRKAHDFSSLAELLYLMAKEARR